MTGREGSKCKCKCLRRFVEDKFAYRATVTRYFCLHLTSVTSVLLSRYVCSYTLFFYKNVVFPAQAEYSYFSADFRLKIFLYYSYIIAYDISVLKVFGIWMCVALHCACAPPRFVAVSEAKMSRQTTLGRFGFEKSISHRNSVMETKEPDFVSTMSRTIECNHLKL